MAREVSQLCLERDARTKSSQLELGLAGRTSRYLCGTSPFWTSSLWTWTTCMASIFANRFSVCLARCFRRKWKYFRGWSLPPFSARNGNVGLLVNFVSWGTGGLRTDPNDWLLNLNQHSRETFTRNSLSLFIVKYTSLYFTVYRHAFVVRNFIGILMYS